MKILPEHTLKDTIRNPFAWPGGYTRIVLLSDGESLCVSCAKDNFRQIAYATKYHLNDGWRYEGTYVHWEGEPELCCHCGKELPSEYGNPDEENA